MIVKDEEKHLRNCLESVKDHVDEIIIVDTGSTDGTIEIATEYATVLECIEWEGFSHARNRSIDLATNDTILILDADEEITNPELLGVAQTEIEQNKADAVTVRINNLLPQNQLLEGDVIWQIRLFRSCPEFRYIGKVHNQIAEPIKQNPLDGKDAKIIKVPLEFRHHGYNLSPEELKEKYSKRVQAMKDEVIANREAGHIDRAEYYNFQVANAYFMMKEYDTCLAWIRVTDLDKLTSQNGYSALIIAAHSCYTMQLYVEGLKYAKAMLELKPEEAMSFLFMGMSYMLLEKWAAAYTFLGSTLALQQYLNEEFSYKLDHAYICGPAGECALKLGRLGEAKTLFADYLRRYPNDPKIQRLYDAIIPIEDYEAGQEGKEQIPDSRKTDSPEQSE